MLRIFNRRQLITTYAQGYCSQKAGRVIDSDTLFEHLISKENLLNIERAKSENIDDKIELSIKAEKNKDTFSRCLSQVVRSGDSRVFL